LIDRRPALTWQSAQDLVVDGIHFFATMDPDEYLRRESTVRELVLPKSREMVENLARSMADADVHRVVDIGIFKGGSTALIATLFRPRCLTALELGPEPVSALTDFIRLHRLEDVVRPRYGFDQSNAGALRAAIDEDHGREPLDLVVDDGSHLYRETRSSFEVLFPRLRPGGKYIIEDWAWAHYPEPLWQAAGGWFHDRPALTNLVVEILMVLGSRCALVREVRAFRDTVEIVRGPDPQAEPVRLECCYVNRGLPFRPLL
jgi:predicted O-methyltransferase YrrM